MDVIGFGVSDIGRQRQHNEDSYVVESGAKLFIVADGMGGHAAGEIASRIAVEAVIEFILNSDEEEGTWPYAYDERLKRSTNRLVAALKMANRRVLEAMRQDARLRGMGTTIVASMFDGDIASFAHVGDSRAYMIRDSRISRITNDHSWVYEQVQAGMLSEAEAEKHPLRNVITRALGGAVSIHPDAAEVDCRPGDTFLLCSDGLTGMVPEEEILEIITQSLDVEQISEQLVARANEHGGQDNITALVVRTIEGSADQAEVSDGPTSHDTDENDSKPE